MTRRRWEPRSRATAFDAAGQEWKNGAACKDLPRWLFFGAPGERGDQKKAREAKAKAVCVTCPVRTDCLDYAISRPERYGTWGGLNEDERAAERRRRMRRRAA
jgi:WhiB family redox-sensing transcriptional regulator